MEPGKPGKWMSSSRTSGTAAANPRKASSTDAYVPTQRNPGVPPISAARPSRVPRSSSTTATARAASSAMSLSASGGDPPSPQPSRQEHGHAVPGTDEGHLHETRSFRSLVMTESSAGRRAARLGRACWRCRDDPIGFRARAGPGRTRDRHRGVRRGTHDSSA